MNIEVGRSNWFKGPTGGTLLWSEVSPPKPHQHRQVCNCTKEVEERPEGPPKSVNQEITFSDVERGVRFEFGLNNMWAIFRWEEGFDPHAYFQFNPENSIGFEVYSKGQCYVDYFFGRLYLGNQVELSKLISKRPYTIIDLSAIKPQDLWAHEASWDGDMEEVEFFRTSEVVVWTAAIDAAERIRKAGKPYLADQASSVEDLRKMILEDKALLADVKILRRIIHPYARGIEATELFKLVGGMRERLAAREKSRDARRRLDNASI